MYCPSKYEFTALTFFEKRLHLEWTDKNIYISCDTNGKESVSKQTCFFTGGKIKQKFKGSENIQVLLLNEVVERFEHTLLFLYFETEREFLF